MLNNRSQPNRHAPGSKPINYSITIQDGRSFIIQNQAQFARDLLPLNYKHNNMASFIRQLNMCKWTAPLDIYPRRSPLLHIILDRVYWPAAHH